MSRGRIDVLVLFACIASATHLVYDNPSVAIPAQLLALPAVVTVYVNPTFQLLPNRKYGVVFRFNEAVSRTFMAGTSANQTGLYINGLTPNVVMPIYWNFAIVPNVGVSPVASAPTPITLQTNNGDYGFGQTFDSGAGGTLSNLKISGAALLQGACSTTLRIFDLTTWVPTSNFSFLQETPQPTLAPTTGKPTTSAPTLAPTVAPTVAPTTPVPTATPTTRAPTFAPTTREPTTATPTHSPTTPQPTNVPTQPTNSPTPSPTTKSPTGVPTTAVPTDAPTTIQPSKSPTTWSPTVPSAKPTSSPTYSPTTVTPSVAPTAQPSPPPTDQVEYFSSSPTTPQPTLQKTTSAPSTTAPTTHAPSPQFFKPPNCGDVEVPIEYFGQTVICNYTEVLTPTPGVISNVVTIIIRDENGTEIPVNNLPPGRQITFFIPFAGDPTFRESSDGCGTQTVVQCAWLTEDQSWVDSGCQVNGELGQVGSNGTIGRYCTCGHLTSFALVLQKARTFCRSLAQYICAAIAGLIAAVAAVQMFRSLHGRKFDKVALIHFAISLACLMLMGLSLFSPDLASVPSIMVLLSSLVTFIELGCYILLLYVWVGAGENRVEFAQKLKRAFIFFAVLTALIVVGFPIAIAATEEHARLELVRWGSYLMSLLTFLICCFISISGFQLRASLLRTKVREGGNKTCPVTSRILIGSIALSLSVMTQSLLWVTSVVDTVMANPDTSAGVELGFNIAAFVTFITLLFMFFFGVHHSDNNAAAVQANRKRGSASSVALNPPRVSSSCSPQLDSRRLHSHSPPKVVEEPLVIMEVVQEDQDMETV